MLPNETHPLFGKETICHKCSGVAVWVFNGDMVGNYHFCRVCKVETGPFAKSIAPPPPPKAEESDVKLFDWPPDLVFLDGTIQKLTPLQIDTQMEMQDRMDQLLFDFMKPPSTEETLKQLGFKE